MNTDEVMESYDTDEILKLAGLKDQITQKNILPKENEKVSDSDNDGKGYKYASNIYNMFGGEKQKLRYVPARSADNPLREGKSFADYLNEVSK